MNYNALVFVGYFTQTGRSASGSSHPTDFFVNQYIKHFFIVAKKPLHVGRTYLAKIEKYVISGVTFVLNSDVNSFTQVIKYMTLQNSIMLCIIYKMTPYSMYI